MTEENRNENEEESPESSDNPDIPNNQQDSAGESAPEPPETSQPGTAAVISRGSDASDAFPDQVRAALEYAAANQYEYGPRLQDVELSWDVVSVEPMANDIVRVRLEYSPTSSFRGDSGIEYMDVDSGGAILARRQIRMPKENKPVALMGITAFSVILAAVLISLMTVFKSDEGDPLYVAGRTLWIRSERPTAQPVIHYEGASSTGEIATWEIHPENPEDNELVYIKVTLINESSGRVALVIDKEAATLLDVDREKYRPLNAISSASPAAADPKYTVEGFIPMWGSLELKKGEQVAGMLVFELPKGSTITELRWDASDSAIIRYQ
jgi:hypothetical protein